MMKKLPIVSIGIYSAIALWSALLVPVFGWGVSAGIGVVMVFAWRSA